jgi:hypothetical protein
MLGIVLTFAAAHWGSNMGESHAGAAFVRSAMSARGFTHREVRAGPGNRIAHALDEQI